ncbi:YuiA family protein [Bacillus sp. 7884-1]|jgi:DnaJ-class molecular chaperone|nr:YuiA family protein [Bacillus sp. 7884-1]
MKTTSLDTKTCDYCSGTGYFQLLLGGSETCTCCEGSGKKQEKY